MTWADSVRLSVGTLTVLPVGPVGRLDARVAGTAMLVAPLAVLPVALAAGVAGWLGHRLTWPPLVVGLLVVAVLALGTRALHLDGLADTVDGLGAGWDADTSLAVMRRGDVGPMGVVALVLVLGLQAAAAGSLVTGWRGAAGLVVLICCSRVALLLVCRAGVPAARPDGLGAAVAGVVPVWAAAVAWLLVALLLGGLQVWRGQPVWLGPVAALSAAAAVLALLRRCVGRFGGVTGDVMGAAVEVAFTVLVLLAAT